VPIDERLLDVARDDALIPINDIMIGIFSWTNRENITCNRLARVAADAPQEQLHLWLTLLNSYNYLAASKYRNLQRPADPAFKHELKTRLPLSNPEKSAWQFRHPCQARLPAAFALRRSGRNRIR
jgi:hypothetical protein